MADKDFIKKYEARARAQGPGPEDKKNKEITGREELEKWEKTEIKKSSKARYGISITKKRLHDELQALKPCEEVVYQDLRLYADRWGICWPSMRNLAKDLNLDKNTIQKSIRTLKKKGFLKIKTKVGKGGKRFEYYLQK